MGLPYSFGAAIPMIWGCLSRFWGWLYGVLGLGLRLGINYPQAPCPACSIHLNARFEASLELLLGLGLRLRINDINNLTHAC